MIAAPRAGARTRWGISVRARLGGAVTRNRIRRRLREILRRAETQLPAGWDVVVEPRTPQVARAEFSHLEEELMGVLQMALGNGRAG